MRKPHVKIIQNNNSKANIILVYNFEFWLVSFAEIINAK